MKKILIPFVLAVLLLTALQSQMLAAPIANSNLGREYLVGSSAPERWSTGLFGGYGSRQLTRRGADFDMDFTRGMAYVGYDVRRWITAYAALGIKSVEFNNIDADESSTEMGIGLHFNLLDQEIMDPPLIEDRIRVNADIYIGMNEADWQGQTFEWQEVAANLTVSIVNDLEGLPAYSPESIAVYAGPAYSNNECDEFDTEDSFGFIAGMEVFATKRISFDLSITKFDSETFMGSTSIRF